MEARIENHRASRPDHWQTVEAPLDLAEALRQPSNTNAALVDCHHDLDQQHHVSNAATATRRNLRTGRAAL